jgi:hypothetical protein
VDADKLPPDANWPTPPWPEEVFGWVLQLRYGPDGKIDPQQTKRVNQQLMYTDCGQK